MEYAPPEAQKEILRKIIRLLEEEREALRDLDVERIEGIHLIKLSLLDEISSISWDLTDPEISGLRDQVLYLQTHNRELALRLADMLQGLWKSLAAEGTYSRDGTVKTEGVSLLESKWG